MCLSNVGDNTTTSSDRTVRSDTNLRRRKPGHREGPIWPMPVCSQCPLRVISGH